MDGKKPTSRFEVNKQDFDLIMAWEFSRMLDDGEVLAVKGRAGRVAVDKDSLRRRLEQASLVEKYQVYRHLGETVYFYRSGGGPSLVDDAKKELKEFTTRYLCLPGGKT